MLLHGGEREPMGVIHSDDISSVRFATFTSRAMICLQPPSLSVSGYGLVFSLGHVVVSSVVPV